MTEIGSDFNINLGTLVPLNNRLNLFNFLPTNCTLLSSGRACLKPVSGMVRKAILLPDYLCSSIDNQFEHKFYYHVNNLVIDYDTVLNQISKVDYLLIINYFGVKDKHSDKIANLCQKRNVKIVYDITHSLFDKHDYGDSVVFASLRKMLPLPDGAVINVKIPLAKVSFVDRLNWHLFILAKFVGMVLKNVQCLKALWRPILLYAEHKLDNNAVLPISMSPVSKLIISNLNFDDIKKKRMNNYSMLANSLPKTIQVYPNKVLYFGFPIVLNSKERDKLKQILINSKIYPAIHWQHKLKCVTHGSNNLSTRIMTLPIDQRYSKIDMDRIAKIITQLILF